MELADTCELALSGGEQKLEEAADHRQKLLVEMIDQGLEVPKECAVCQKLVDAHKASVIPQGSKSRIVVASCCHLFHKGCLRTLHSCALCPVCREPLLLLLQTVKRT